MITSIVGRLIKKPEVAERIQIPGKRIVNFTVVENRTRGERRLAVFFNLSMVVGTDAQFDLVMRFEKGTVLLFSSPRITYVRQSERSESEQSINLYAEVDNFKIVVGADMAPAAGAASADLLEPAFEEEAPAPPRRPGQTTPAAVRPEPRPSAGVAAAVTNAATGAKARRPAPRLEEELAELSDPFAEEGL